MPFVSGMRATRGRGRAGPGPHLAAGARHRRRRRAPAARTPGMSSAPTAGGSLFASRPPSMPERGGPSQGAVRSGSFPRRVRSRQRRPARVGRAAAGGLAGSPRARLHDPLRPARCPRAWEVDPVHVHAGERFPAQFVITGVLGPGSTPGPNEFLHVPTGVRVTACVAEILADHYRRPALKPGRGLPRPGRLSDRPPRRNFAREWP